MAKVKKAEKAPEEADKKLVSVEMTEDEKKSFAEFMAQKEIDAEKAAIVQPQAHGELRFAHYINGTQYGPGKFSAPKDLAVTLVQNDQKYLHKRMREKEGEEYMIDIMARGPGKITKVEKQDIL